MIVFVRFSPSCYFALIKMSDDELVLIACASYILLGEDIKKKRKRIWRMASLFKVENVIGV